MATSRYSIWQVFSMGLGGALLALQSWLLVDYARDAGMPMAQIVSVPVVTITLAISPILTEMCLRKGHWIKALGLCLVFLLGLAYTLPSAIGRAGEARDTAIAEAQASIHQSQLLEDQLTDAKARLGQAQDAEAAECSTGKGPACKGWKSTVAERQARVDQLMMDSAKLGALKIAPSDAPRIAAVMGLSERVVNLYLPLALPLALEVGVWVLLFVGLSPGLVQQPSPARKEQIATVEPELDGVIAALKRARRPVSNDEIASLMGISKGEASKRVTELNGSVFKRRVGRQVEISLPPTIN